MILVKVKLLKNALEELAQAIESTSIMTPQVAISSQELRELRLPRNFRMLRPMED